MKKNAFGLIELIIVAVIMLVIFLMYGNPLNSSNNPIGEMSKVKNQKEMVNQKVQDVEAIRQKSINANTIKGEE